MKRTIVFLLALLAPLTAAAQFQQVRLSPTACNDDAINTAINCEIAGTALDGGAVANVQKTWGWSYLTLDMTYTRAAGDGFTFYFEVCNENSGVFASDCTDAADWHRVSLDATSGSTTTLSNEGIASGTMAATGYRVWTVRLNYWRTRLAAITATGAPTASDKIKVTMTLSKGI